MVDGIFSAYDGGADDRVSWCKTSSDNKRRDVCQLGEKAMYNALNLSLNIEVNPKSPRARTRNDDPSKSHSRNDHDK